MSKPAESDSGESVALLKAIAESTADGLLAVDREGHVLFSNARFATMWRIPDDLIEERNDSKLLMHVLDQLSDPGAFISKVQELYASRQEAFDTISFKDGRTFERYSCPLIQDGNLVGRVWSFRNVTERVQIMRALRGSQQRQREILEHLPAGVGIAGLDERLIVVNRAFCDIVGYEVEEALGMRTLDLIDREYHSKIRSETELRKTGVSSAYDAVMTRKDGSKRIVEVSAVPYRDDDGKIVGTTGLLIDITEKRAAEEALRRSEQRYRDLIEQLPVGVAIARLDETFELANEALGRILKRDVSELLGTKFTEHVKSQFAEAVRRQTESRREGKASAYEVEMVRSDGESRFVRVSAAPNMNDAGEVIGTLGIMEDITEEKRNEAIRRSQEREIELYGSLLRHDIRNDLGIIMSYIEAARMLSSELTEQTAGFLDSAIAIIQRTSNLLTGVGRPSEVVETGLVEFLDKLSEDAVSANKDLKITVVPDPDVKGVKVATGSLLTMVFHNLFLNTIQHAGTQSKIEIAVKRHDEAAHITVSDDGPGVPDSVRGRLFQRGVSTKGESGGLGLYLCRQIIEAKGGSIELLPQVKGKGASFLITVPVVSSTN